MTGPRHGLQALGLHLAPALDAFTVASLVHSFERFLHQSKQRAIAVGLAEEKLLGVRVGSFISGILGGVVVRGTAVLFDSRDHSAELLLLCKQALLIALLALLVHHLVSTNFQVQPNLSMLRTV